MKAELWINGEARPWTQTTVTELLRREVTDPGRRGVAVAVNGRVVPRQDWATTDLAPNDRVEIVKPFVGG